MSYEFNPAEEDPHGECRHEIEQLRARVLELERTIVTQSAVRRTAEVERDELRDKSFMAVCDRVARDLPDGWTIVIHLEHTAGTVGLDSPNGDEVEFPSNYECMLDQVNDALQHAIELELPL